MHIKGMVQVLGITYRVVEHERGGYEVIRICDEVVVGEFSCGQLLAVTAKAVDIGLMKQIASAAVRSGRTSWTGRDSTPDLAHRVQSLSWFGMWAKAPRSSNNVAAHAEFAG